MKAFLNVECLESCAGVHNETAQEDIFYLRRYLPVRLDLCRHCGRRGYGANLLIGQGSTSVPTLMYQPIDIVIELRVV